MSDYEPPRIEGTGIRIKCLEHQDHPVEGCDTCRFAFQVTEGAIGWSLVGTPDPPTFDDESTEERE